MRPPTVLLLRRVLVALGGITVSSGCGSGTVTAPSAQAETQTITIGQRRYTSIATPITVSPLMIMDSLLVTNIGTQPDTLIVGGCWLLMRAYRSAARTGTPAYDPLTQGGVCTMEARLVPLAPGIPARFVGSIGAADLRAAGLPAGRYWFTILLSSSNGPPVELAAGDATFAP